MSDNSPAANEKVTPTISREFYIRVNDFLEMANRIERRYDSHHAEIAMMHAFCRYSAHHFLKTAGDDTAQKRAQFAELLAADVHRLVTEHLKDMAGEQPAVAGSAAPEGGATGS